MYFSTSDLRRIDSMTKYPEIKTYHNIDPTNGKLLEDRINTLPEDDTLIYVTEKIDGVNTRIITFPDGDWIIGSRKELLTCEGDRIANPSCRIVEAVRPLAIQLAIQQELHPVTVFYGEVYGGDDTVGPRWRNYTQTKGEMGFRIFDVVKIYNYREMLTWPIEKIASWRDHGGQQFVNATMLHTVTAHLQLELVPELFVRSAHYLPTSLQDTFNWMSSLLPRTNVALTEELIGAAEGVVLRSFDRKFIAKARFQEYNRTLKRR